MKKVFYYVMLPFILTVSFGFIAISEGKKDLKCTSFEIVKKFPGKHILSLNDLDKETRYYFKSTFPNNNPGIVESDLNGDGNRDYSILLRDNNSSTTKLLIFFCLKNLSLKKMYELDVTSLNDIVFLNIVNKDTFISQTEAIDIKNEHLLSKKLIHDGVKLTYFGKAEIVLFWNDKLKKIETIQTSD